MKKIIIVAMCLVSMTSCFGAEQYFINHTKSDIVLSYETCHIQMIYDGPEFGYEKKTLGCDAPAKLSLAAMTKVHNVFPLIQGYPVPPRTFNVDYVDLISIMSPSGKFDQINFIDELFWDKNCNRGGPPPICRFLRKINPMPGDALRSENGAWIINDYDVGFVTFEYKQLG